MVFAVFVVFVVFAVFRCLERHSIRPRFHHRDASSTSSRARRRPLQHDLRRFDLAPLETALHHRVAVEASAVPAALSEAVARVDEVVRPRLELVIKRTHMQYTLQKALGLLKI